MDDNVYAAEGLAKLLRLHGHTVAVAFDGPGGLAAARADRPDVVFLDIGLPGLDGYEVARRLRVDVPDGVTLVALTGFGQDADHGARRAAGFDHYLVKPAEPGRTAAAAGGREQARRRLACCFSLRRRLYTGDERSTERRQAGQGGLPGPWRHICHRRLS